MFARLIETERGQVLTKLDSCDEGYEVRIFFEPEEMGVCSVGFNFDDDNADAAEKPFIKLTDDDVKKIAFEALDKIKGMLDGQS